MIIVDTNVWSETAKSKGDEQVVRWLGKNKDELILSAIVLSELYFGASLLPAGRRKGHLRLWVAGLEAQFPGDILPFDEKAALIYGELAAAAKARGKNSSTIDRQIAAQAKAYGLSLATRNVKDFADFDIELINPWSS